MNLNHTPQAKPKLARYRPKSDIGPFRISPLASSFHLFCVGGVLLAAAATGLVMAESSQTQKEEGSSGQVSAAVNQSSKQQIEAMFSRYDDLWMEGTFPATVLTSDFDELDTTLFATGFRSPKRLTLKDAEVKYRTETRDCTTLSHTTRLDSLLIDEGRGRAYAMITTQKERVGPLRTFEEGVESTNRDASTRRRTFGLASLILRREKDPETGESAWKITRWIPLRANSAPMTAGAGDESAQFAEMPDATEAGQVKALFVSTFADRDREWSAGRMAYPGNAEDLSSNWKAIYPDATPWKTEDDPVRPLEQVQARRARYAAQTKDVSIQTEIFEAIPSYAVLEGTDLVVIVRARQRISFSTGRGRFTGSRQFIGVFDIPGFRPRALETRFLTQSPLLDHFGF